MNATHEKLGACELTGEGSTSVESFVEGLLNHNPNPMWVSDPNGLLVKINDSCLEQLKVTKDEVVGIYNVFDDNVIEEQGVMPLLKEVFETGKGARFEICYDSSLLKSIKFKNSVSLVLDVTIITVKGDDHKIAYVVFQQMDISRYRQTEEDLLSAYAKLEKQFQERTADLIAANEALSNEIAERKFAEEDLRKSEETLKNLVELMPVGVGWIDRYENIEYLNHCFVDMFGYTLDDIPTLRELYAKVFPDPGYRAEVIAARAEKIKKVKTSGAPMAPMDLKVVCKDGMVRHVIMNNQLVCDRCLTVLIDITDRELLQDRLIKSQKIESLGVLASGIAHDFNNILTGILGFISLARMHLDESHKSYDLLRQAENSSKRAAKVATQLMTFASGSKPIKKTLDVLKLVSDSVSLSLRGTNVLGSVEIATSVHAVKADEMQLGQAFNNIIINAVQAMPDGGTLKVLGENVTLDSNNQIGLQAGQYVKISFRDEGCGIPEDIQKKIFDPYFTTKTDGSGLGLTSVHSIVNKHGGCVCVGSQVGGGTTFTVYLPSAGDVTSLQGNQQNVLPGDKQASGGILLMDDEETIRNLARETLGFLGYRVTTCNNGEEAIALFKAARESGKPFMAVILDLTIPGGMGGKEAAQHILEIDPSARLIVSSGYTNDPVMAGYRNYGFCAAVTKPYKASELGEELGALLLRGH